VRPSDHLACGSFPCAKVRHECFLVPEIEVDPAAISTIVVAEAAPQRAADYFYAGPDALFARTTLLAFREAGMAASNMADLLSRGIYLTTAVKCGKTGYLVGAGPIKECGRLLEQEIALFPNATTLLLMGEVAVRAVNALARARDGHRVVPAGATYRLRGRAYAYGSLRVFPSYLQAGPAYFLEKSKRAMIAEDIRLALGRG
jgi:uracil-DNA glycosylase